MTTRNLAIFKVFPSATKHLGASLSAGALPFTGFSQSAKLQEKLLVPRTVINQSATHCVGREGSISCAEIFIASARLALCGPGFVALHKLEACLICANALALKPARIHPTKRILRIESAFNLSILYPSSRFTKTHDSKMSALRRFARIT